MSACQRRRSEQNTQEGYNGTMNVNRRLANALSLTGLVLADRRSQNNRSRSALVTRRMKKMLSRVRRRMTQHVIREWE
jgi:hypothetical protein